MDWDEHEVVQALNRMGVDGPQIIRNVLAGRIESAIEETKEVLKKMAGPLEMVEVYPWDRFGFSDNIYVKVANALKYDEVPGQEHFRLLARHGSFFDGLFQEDGSARIQHNCDDEAGHTPRFFSHL
jgi:hypothetical protein